MTLALLSRVRFAALALALLGAIHPGASALAGSVDISTFHVDSQRTGWNANETTLDWANVNPSQFVRQLVVTLDQQVDAQPLIVSAATLAAAGKTGYPNDVAIVVTENDTIYEIDSGTGAVIRSRHLGTPVAEANLPGQCSNNSTVVGITSTPVLDPTELAIYAVTYTWEGQAPVYRMRKLKFDDLSDIVVSVKFAANASLSDGTTVSFNPQSQRQRPALLLANSRVYAAFGSFCDQDADTSRGWIFANNPTTLRTESAAIADTQTIAQSTSAVGGAYFLSAIWMSGYGLATDSLGYLYTLTSNSDRNNADNYPESALKLLQNLEGVKDYFTPYNFANLDAGDRDYGSGGIMVVPDQPNGLEVAVAAGKDGRMFMLDRKRMGGYVAGGPDVPRHVDIGGCWCGPSYFVGSDAKPRVVSSGGAQVETWFLPVSASGTLTLEATSPNLPATSQDPGFFTFISSNGEQAGSAIVWAVSRPSNGYVWLSAYKADGGLTQLYSAAAGFWVNGNSNADIFPVAAGGKVYVASYKHLEVFGLKSAPTASAKSAAPALASADAEPAPLGGARFYGTVSDLSLSAGTFTLNLRDGSRLAVDLTRALAAHASAPLYDQEALEVQGSLGADGVLSAWATTRAKGAAGWGSDIR